MKYMLSSQVTLVIIAIIVFSFPPYTYAGSQDTGSGSNSQDTGSGSNSQDTGSGSNSHHHGHFGHFVLQAHHHHFGHFVQQGFQPSQDTGSGSNSQDTGSGSNSQDTGSGSNSQDTGSGMHPTALTLNAISNVPSGTTVTIAGNLTDVSTNSPVGGATITFNGTGAANSPSVVTASNGTFSATVTAPNNLANGWRVQAHYAGGDIHASSNSTINTYNTN